MTKERCLSLEKRTFLWLEPQVVLTQLAENLLNNLKMFFEGLRSDQNVVEVDVHGLAELLLKDLLHGSLKAARSIGQTEWKYVELPVSSQGRESGKLLGLR